MFTKMKNMKINTRFARTFTQVHPVKIMQIFEKTEKTFFIAKYSNFNLQNRGFSIEKKSEFLFSVKENSVFFSIKRNSYVFSTREKESSVLCSTFGATIFECDHIWTQPYLSATIFEHNHIWMQPYLDAILFETFMHFFWTYSRFALYCDFSPFFTPTFFGFLFFTHILFYPHFIPSVAPF